MALLALGAIFAGGASAHELFKSTSSAWYTGVTPGTKLSGTKTLKMSAATPLAIELSIGAGPIKMEASGIECPGCTIENEGTSARLKGRLRFTGLRWVSPEPANCRVATSLESNAISGTVSGQAGVGQPALKIAPTEGETWWTLTILGETCPLQGTYKFTGTVFSEFANSLGVDSKVQSIKFSKSIQESLGSESPSWRLGGNAAWITGTVKLSLSPEVEFQLKRE